MPVGTCSYLFFPTSLWGSCFLRLHPAVRFRFRFRVRVRRRASLISHYTTHLTQLCHQSSHHIHLKPFISHHSSHSTHHTTTHLTSLISHHSSHTTHHTPLISHNSYLTSHFIPFISHHSPQTIHLIPLISRHSPQTIHLRFISHHSSRSTHHTTTHLTPVISHHSSHSTHLTPLISHHSSHSTQTYATHLTPLISQHSNIHYLSYTSHLIPTAYSGERHKTSHVGLSGPFILSESSIFWRWASFKSTMWWCYSIQSRIFRHGLTPPPKFLSKNRQSLLPQFAIGRSLLKRSKCAKSYWGQLEKIWQNNPRNPRERRVGNQS